jgi:hypothetical protein
MFTETLIKIQLCDWPMFSSADLSLAGGKCTRINFLTQAGSGMIFQDHRRVNGSIFKIRNFKGAG